MAKQTHDREDLLRDGTAMPVRGRFLVGTVEVVVGFRSKGQVSLYWDQDPVFQFDELGQLRRVFFDATRFKAQDGRLVRMAQASDQAAPSVGRLRLAGELISDSDQRRILQRLSDCLQQMEQAFANPSADHGIDTLRCVGANQRDFVFRVRNWLTSLRQPLTISHGPWV